MSSSWKTIPCLSVLSWSVCIVPSFNYSDAKNELLYFIFKKKIGICHDISIFFYSGIAVSAHQPICNRGSWVSCGLMAEVLSKSSKNSRGNITVCNYFWTGSLKEWCIWMLPFLFFLLKPLNKNAVFPHKFEINKYDIVGKKFFRKSTVVFFFRELTLLYLSSY